MLFYRLCLIALVVGLTSGEDSGGREESGGAELQHLDRGLGYIYFKDDIIGTGKTALLVNSQPMAASSYLSSEALPPLFLSISLKPLL